MSGIVLIVVIVVVVLVAGVLLARSGFLRGTLPATPSEDAADQSATRADEARREGSVDPSAVGRPPDRGYDQGL